ncbi:hypothetical protein FHR99_002780 [Litorivivens lipolytica]|uniref:Uncharacterized protein n=1 Tax=Litorivivens lipolytica TaxID=1524264 RepID=A0A7W4W6Q5_9GAMM|nr:hypothetical protein [Litorivivens lipolytica]MBB3048506.1 hypothetical protein [Litorivivens lipolytica]
MGSSALIQAVRYLGWALLLSLLALACLAMYLPAAPSMPIDDVDPAWIMGMAYALANNLVIGRELIFTFGPFAGVYTKAYQPEIFHFSLIAASILALGLFLLLAYLKQGVRYYWILLVALVPIGLNYMGDPVFLMYPYLLGLFLNRALEAEREELHISLNWLNKVAFVLMLLPLGLLPLIKGSFLVGCLGSVVLCLGYSAWHRNRFFLITLSVVPLLALITGWMLSGHSVADLPNYFSAMSPIISGYAQAMSDPGNEAPLLLYVIACIVLGWQFLFRSETPASACWFLALNAGMFLFLAFKAGFVRYDSHALIAALSLLIAVLSMRFVRVEGASAGLIVLALLAWMSIDRQHRETSTNDFYQHLKDAFKSTSKVIRDYDELDAQWRQDYHAALDKIVEGCGLDSDLQGRVDIYPWRISCAIAADLNWSGRPILQSYSVYTEELLVLNRNHLRSSRAPDTLLFDVAPIDGRYPSLDESLSWPVFVQHFKVTESLDQFLKLERRDTKRELTRERLRRSEARLGKVVVLPENRGNLWAEFKLKSTFLGRLWALFIKPPELMMTVMQTSGEQEVYRLVPEIAKAGFLLSPTLEDREQFADWLQRGEADTGVAQITIEAQYGAGVLWQSDYQLTLSSFQFPAEVLTPEAGADEGIIEPKAEQSDPAVHDVHAEEAPAI